MKINTMNKYLLIFCLFTIIGCSSLNPTRFNSNSSQFNGRYQDHIEPNEKVIASWYHYVKTKLPSGEHILRTFFPETKQITSELRFKDKSLSSKSGLAKQWHENGHLKSEGIYRNDQAEGEWKFYNRYNGNL